MNFAPRFIRLLTAGLLALIAAFAIPAQATDLHTVMLDRCQAKSGIIVHVDEARLVLLQLDGTSEEIKREQIESLYISSTLENPIPKIAIDPALQSALKRVVIKDEEFIGWPVRFIEQLVMFYDLAGKTRVYEKRRLTKLRPITALKKNIDSPGQAINIDWSGVSTKCEYPKAILKNGNLNVQPIRVLEDQIKVVQYLDDLADGYADLDSYQERTYLYARPIVFNQTSRLSFILPAEELERQLDGMISFRWGGGEPYHFQSFNRFGQQYLEFGPAVKSVFAVRSDLKAHLFHTHISGDIRGLPGGSSIYTKDYRAALNEKMGGTSEIQTGINYVLLMGGDFGPLSASVGYYYPIHFIRVGDRFREILASRQSYAFRGMWTTSKLRFRAITSIYAFDSQTATTSEIEIDHNGVADPVRAFAFKGKFLRAGVDWDITSANRLTADFVSTDGEYSGTRTSGGRESFSFIRRSIIGGFYQDFGDYVGVGVLGTWVFTNTEHMGFPTAAATNSQSQFILGGELEFIF